jgi:hypothetical protein
MCASAVQSFLHLPFLNVIFSVVHDVAGHWLGLSFKTLNALL